MYESGPLNNFAQPTAQHDGGPFVPALARRAEVDIADRTNAEMALVDGMTAEPGFALTPAAYN